MQEKEEAAGEFIETLRATAAAVGQRDVTLDMDRNSRPAEVDADREARVTELQRQYLEGSYRAEAGEVAARLIDDHMV